MNELWEILVPASNREIRFSYIHHKKWDRKVLEIAGGVTVFKGVKGEWISPTGKLFKDRVIPCRIACSKEQILKIIDFTIVHYSQEAVLAYKISEDVIIKYKGDESGND